jgi:hypothetical protein
MDVKVKDYAPFALTGRTFSDGIDNYLIQNVKGREEGMIVSGTKTRENAKPGPFELILSQENNWFKELK